MTDFEYSTGEQGFHIINLLTIFNIVVDDLFHCYS